MEVFLLRDLDWRSARVVNWISGLGGTIIVFPNDEQEIKIQNYVALNRINDISFEILKEPRPGDELLVMPIGNGEYYWIFKSTFLHRLPHFTQTLRLVSKEKFGSRKKVLWAGSARDPILLIIIADNKPKKGVYQIAGITLWFEVLQIDFTWRKIYRSPFR
ncbi:MAG: hypothetical protein Q8P53_01930 [Candidatus Shapirobacteria bacterium]|nr:hypothetical protein [Candidatus Shapirobacteria bacterium]